MLITAVAYGRLNRALLRLIPLLLWTFSSFSHVCGQKLDAPLPPRDGYVSDHAHVLQDSTRANVGVVLQNLEGRTGLEFVIATVPDTGSLSSEYYAQVLMKAWGVGSREQGIRGLLLLFSTHDRRYQMVWSSDVEVELPKSFLEQLIEQLKEPLRNYDYDAAVTLAARAVSDKLGTARGFGFDELTREVPDPGGRSTSNPPRSAPALNSRGLLKLGLKITGMLVGFVVAALLLFKLAMWLISLGHAREFETLTIWLLIALTLSPLVVILGLWPSQTTILNSWAPRVGPMSERSFWAERVYGAAPNRFHVDVWGYVTELHITNAAVSKPTELSGLESLTRLRTLEISNTPLEGTLDLSRFRDLEQLDLHGTGLSNVSGLENLTQLTALNLSDTNVNDLRPLERAEYLKELHLSGMNLERVVGLESLWRVTKLRLDRCTGLDLRRVAMLYQLEEITLEGIEDTDLSPLASLGSLTRLGLAGSRISDVAPLAKLKLSLLDVRGSSVKREDAERTFNYPLVVFYGEKDASLVRISSGAKAWLILGYIGSFIMLCVLSYPLPKAMRRRPILILRRVTRRMFVGAILVLLLLTIANLEWSIAFYHLDFPPLGGKITVAAAIAAVLWLVLRPLILLLLETRVVNSSRWGVSLLTLSRMIPWIVIGVPIAALLIYSALNAASSLTGIFRYVIFILVVWISLSMVLPLLKLVLPAFIWRGRIKKIRRALAEKETNQGLVLEIPLQYTSRSLIYRAWFGFFKNKLERLLPSSGEPKPKVLTTFSVGLLDHIPITADDRNKLLGALVVIRSGQLEQARPWEFRMLGDWIASTYRATWAPLWIVLDSAEKPTSSSIEIERNLKALEDFAPHLSGYVRQRLTAEMALDANVPESISTCLEANQLTNNQALMRAGLDDILQKAFTPVAALCRSVFGFPQLANRLDTLIRTTETAIAYFVLVLVAEYENGPTLLDPNQGRKLDGAIKTHLKHKLPVFSSWQSVLNAFCNRSPSKLANLISDAWDMPALDIAFDLRDMLSSVAGEGAALKLPSKLETRREQLNLVRIARNVITAHGPTLDQVASELYLTVFAVVLDLLSSLPWTALTLQHIGLEGIVTEFRGCVPVSTQTRCAGALPPGSYVKFHGLAIAEESELLAVSRYFYTTVNPVSVAMHVGEDGFFDPIAGRRI